MPMPPAKTPLVGGRWNGCGHLYAYALAKLVENQSATHHQYLNVVSVVSIAIDPEDS
jgi:hypothetical protein